MSNKSEHIYISNAVKEQLQKVIAEKIENVILYGSYARGDQSYGSDIDLLLILKEDLTKKEISEVNQILSEISLQYDIVVSCNSYTKSDYTTRNTPFLINVKKEGILV